MKKTATALFLLLLIISNAVCAIGEGAELWQPTITEEMPVISITTDDGSNHFATAYDREAKLEGDIEYVDAVVSVSGPDASDTINEAPAQVKARGNWTLNYPKKSIRIKFAEKQNLLGLNEGRAFKSWVLLAEWKDLAMLNNATALFMAHNILGADGYYCSDYRFVQLYLNGEYWGVYLLAEQQEVNSGRVDIAEAEGDEQETGYFFEYDYYFYEEASLPEGDPVFEISHYGSLAEQRGYTVKSDTAYDNQVEYLEKCMRIIYRICHEAVTYDKHFAFDSSYTSIVSIEGSSPQETVGQVVDLASLVDTYILSDIVYNPDINWSSFYISLDMSESSNKKLTFQAPWDFDSCFGIRYEYCDSQYLNAAASGNPWFSLFADEDWFQEMVSARWDELCEAGLPEKTLALIDTFEDTYESYFNENYERWPERITEGNHELTDEINGFTTQREAADRLKRWLEERFELLDSVW